MTVTELLLSGGPILVVIILVSIYAVYLFVERLLKLNRERSDTTSLMARVNAAVRERDLDTALDACERHGGPTGRVLKSALERLPYGRPAVEAAFEEATITEEQNLTRGLTPLAIMAKILPMLGLLGTVTGMIISFSEISLHGSGDAGQLAYGIGQALVTTAAGLIVAIPVLVGHGYLNSLVSKLLGDIDKRREELMGSIVRAVADRRDEGGVTTYRQGSEPQAERNVDMRGVRPAPQA
ncbi:MAG TPA: MotA/TolQ/ExbB proton channel family protein [Trueperaceae bacterium]|jgi:biopolymer transport protein ExbB|nr:MotA/TolQ/ExbB proton channel family protein [Trueperaceae bacterium]